ncbi:MAG: hypothetical protein ACSHXD_19550 [Marinosulfonomonas sp.]
MKKPTIQRNSEKFFIEVPGGRISADEVGGLSEIAAEMERNQLNPQLFLDAWKDAVQLAGPHYFHVTCPSVSEAVDKQQLCPDMSAISSSLGVLSTGERVFLVSLYQFYCDSDAFSLCEEAGLQYPSLADIALLDRSRRSVLIKLIDSYSGW